MVKSFCAFSKTAIGVLTLCPFKWHSISWGSFGKRSTRLDFVVADPLGDFSPGAVDLYCVPICDGTSRICCEGFAGSRRLRLCHGRALNLLFRPCRQRVSMSQTSLTAEWLMSKSREDRVDVAPASLLSVGLSNMAKGATR